MEKTFLIDSGHGGIIDGRYQTAPKKMFLHEDGSIAMEGVLNRKVKNFVLGLGRDLGIRMIDICPTEVDVRITTRANIVNAYCDELGTRNCLLIDLHSNAGKGEGTEIWTSPGPTMSDIYASMFMDEYQRAFPDARVRKDLSDGDVDKESPFTMLTDTKCPSILPEWRFFDNPKDWEVMRKKSSQYEYAKMIINFAKSVLHKFS